MADGYIVGARLVAPAIQATIKSTSSGDTFAIRRQSGGHRTAIKPRSIR
jgi:hypothetical protein